MTEGGQPSLQVGPLNMAIRQEGDVDVEPDVEVCRRARAQDDDQDYKGIYETVTGDFGNVQLGNGSNIMISKSNTIENRGDLSVRGARPLAEVRTSDKLHYIIDSPKGVVQIGNCCVLLQVDFSSSLVNRLLEEGDINLRLESKDVILKIQWSNWDIKKEEICSRIKLEVRSALEEEKLQFKKDVIKCLLDHVILTNIIDALYQRFNARLYQITGGCIELWVRNESYEKLELMRMKQKEIEALLTRELCHLSDGNTRKRSYWFSVSILDISSDELDMPESKIIPNRSEMRNEPSQKLADKRTTIKTAREPLRKMKVEPLQSASQAVARLISKGEETIPSFEGPESSLKGKQPGEETYHPWKEQNITEASEEQYKQAVSVASKSAGKDMLEFQLKFDQEHRLRKTAEKSLNDGQKTIEELSLKIEELQRQLQTKQTIIDALEMQHNLSASASSAPISAAEDISNMEIVSSSTVVVRMKGDNTEPSITGCVCLPSGQLVLCDCVNNKIKLLSSVLSVEDCIDLQERAPWDISILSSRKVVITLPWEHELQFMKVAPKLQLRHVIKLDKECRCVCVVAGEIYVSCFGCGGNDGEVRVMTIDGIVKKTIAAPIEQQSSYTFSPPLYLTVSARTGRIYAADYDCATLICLSVDGSIIYRYSDPELIFPNGVYVDAADNVTVCGRASDNVQLISPNGKKIRTLITGKDGIKDPYSVTYRATDSSLIVGCLEDDKLHVFKLSHVQITV